MTVRSPVVAGMFYPGQRDVLAHLVDDLLTRANPAALKGAVKGLLAPHAGYMYSGLTAAYGYKLLKGLRGVTVVIAAPSHREHFDGISIYPGDAYRTPLGTVLVDAALRDAIASFGPPIVVSLSGHREEHAVEVHLPFLQRTLEDFSFVPVVMGEQQREYCDALGAALAGACSGKPVVIVASSDLSHYFPYDTARMLDGVAQDDIAQFDPQRLLDDIENERTEACGGGPLAAMLIAAKRLGADRTAILHACNSGDVTGDRSGVVGYLSAVAFKSLPA